MEILFTLIIVASTSSSTQSGSATITADFTTLEKCMVAQEKILNQLTERKNFVLTNGCYAK